MKIHAMLRAVALVAACTFNVSLACAAEVEQLWDRDNPVACERLLKEALQSQPSRTLALKTQLARCLGLHERYPEAQRVLDEVEHSLADPMSADGVRLLLERGRLYWSTGATSIARPLFESAFARATVLGEQALAADAANMVAITLGGTPQARPWSEAALRIARSTDSAYARSIVPAILNNMARDRLELGDPAAALPLFEQSRDGWLEQGKLGLAATTKVGLAECLRQLGRPEQALKTLDGISMQGLPHEVLAQIDEERGHVLKALGKSDDARQAFSSAVRNLRADGWSSLHDRGHIDALSALSQAR